MKFLLDIKKWELHHRMTAFIGIMFITIFLTRVSVFFYNPNPFFFNFEIHHFDYGILLLMISSLLLLFSKPRGKNNAVHISLVAVAFGLIIDDLWFIRSNINDPGADELKIYNATFLSVIIFATAIIFTIALIQHKNNS